MTTVNNESKPIKKSWPMIKGMNPDGTAALEYSIFHDTVPPRIVKTYDVNDPDLLHPQAAVQ